MTAQSPQPRRSSRQSFDLTELANNPDQLSKLVIERPETIEERTERLRIQSRKANFDLVKEGAVVLLVIVGVVAILFYCLTIMQSASASVDDKRWAQAILGAAVTAGLGYLIGKRERS